jgi:uncharacterized RDD family membrane protein YckC
MAATTLTPRTRNGAPAPAVRIEYASFESRLAAATLDVLVILIIASLLVLVGAITILISSDFERIDPSTTSINVFWTCVGAIVPAVLLYFFISFAWKGQTVGAAVMQLMIIRSDGRPLGVLGSVARVIGFLFYLLLLIAAGIVALVFNDSPAIGLGAVGLALVLVFAGILWAVFDNQRRTLHDRLAGTIVVRLR